jgi:hypothetical protein
MTFNSGAAARQAHRIQPHLYQNFGPNQRVAIQARVANATQVAVQARAKVVRDISGVVAAPQLPQSTKPALDQIRIVVRRLFPQCPRNLVLRSPTHTCAWSTEAATAGDAGRCSTTAWAARTRCDGESDVPALCRTSALQQPTPRTSSLRPSFAASAPAGTCTTTTTTMTTTTRRTPRPPTARITFHRCHAPLLHPVVGYVQQQLPRLLHAVVHDAPSGARAASQRPRGQYNRACRRPLCRSNGRHHTARRYCDSRRHQGSACRRRRRYTWQLDTTTTSATAAAAATNDIAGTLFTAVDVRRATRLHIPCRRRPRRITLRVPIAGGTERRRRRRRRAVAKDTRGCTRGPGTTRRRCGLSHQRPSAQRCRRHTLQRHVA